MGGRGINIWQSGGINTKEIWPVRGDAAPVYVGHLSSRIWRVSRMAQRVGVDLNSR